MQTQRNSVGRPGFNHLDPRRNREISVFDLFDAITHSAFEDLSQLGWQAPRQVRELQAGSFPPCDIYTEKENGDYILEIALAGIPKEKVELTTEGQIIHLKVELAERDENGEAKEDGTKFFVQSGIRKFTLLENTWTIPNKFDMLEAKTSYADGLLTIRIPLKPEVKKVEQKRTLSLE
jgi:HSP20 family molecular chaperone IbpA